MVRVLWSYILMNSLHLTLNEIDNIKCYVFLVYFYFFVDCVWLTLLIFPKKSGLPRFSLKWMLCVSYVYFVAASTKFEHSIITNSKQIVVTNFNWNEQEKKMRIWYNDWINFDQNKKKPKKKKQSIAWSKIQTKKTLITELTIISKMSNSTNKKYKTSKWIV